MLGVQDLEQEQFESRFYRLQVEDTTAFSSLESSNPEAVHQDSSSIRLELSLNVRIKQITYELVRTKFFFSKWKIIFSQIRKNYYKDIRKVTKNYMFAVFPLSLENR